MSRLKFLSVCWQNFQPKLTPVHLTYYVTIVYIHTAESVSVSSDEGGGGGTKDTGADEGEQASKKKITVKLMHHNI